MLANIEKAYLGLLRIVILIVASIALLVAGLAGASSLPSLLRQIGVMGQSSTQPALADFIAAKRAEGSAAVDLPETEETAKSTVPEDITTAARIFHDYTKADGSMTQGNWTDELTGLLGHVPEHHQLAYAASLKRLAEELKASQGKRLSLERVRELLAWHHEQYLTSLEGKATQDVTDRATFMMTLGVAGGAFLVFLLVVFIFLFVKIERSLRLVHTVRVPEGE